MRSDGPTRYSSDTRDGTVRCGPTSQEGVTGGPVPQPSSDLTGDLVTDAAAGGEETDWRQRPIPRKQIRRTTGRREAPYRPPRTVARGRRESLSSTASSHAWHVSDSHVSPSDQTAKNPTISKCSSVDDEDLAAVSEVSVLTAPPDEEPVVCQRVGDGGEESSSSASGSPLTPLEDTMTDPLDTQGAVDVPFLTCTEPTNGMHVREAKTVESPCPRIPKRRTRRQQQQETDVRMSTTQSAAKRKTKAPTSRGRGSASGVPTEPGAAGQPGRPLRRSARKQQQVVPAHTPSELAELLPKAAPTPPHGTEPVWSEEDEDLLVEPLTPLTEPPMSQPAGTTSVETKPETVVPKKEKQGLRLKISYLQLKEEGGPTPPLLPDPITDVPADPAVPAVPAVPKSSRKKQRPDSTLVSNQEVRTKRRRRARSQELETYPPTSQRRVPQNAPDPDVPRESVVLQSPVIPESSAPQPSDEGTVVKKEVLPPSPPSVDVLFESLPASTVDDHPPRVPVVPAPPHQEDPSSSVNPARDDAECLKAETATTRIIVETQADTPPEQPAMSQSIGTSPPASLFIVLSPSTVPPPATTSPPSSCVTASPSGVASHHNQVPSDPVPPVVSRKRRSTRRHQTPAPKADDDVPVDDDHVSLLDISTEHARRTVSVDVPDLMSSTSGASVDPPASTVEGRSSRKRRKSQKTRPSSQKRPVAESPPEVPIEGPPTTTTPTTTGRPSLRLQLPPAAAVLQDMMQCTWTTLPPVELQWAGQQTGRSPRKRSVLEPADLKSKVTTPATAAEPTVEEPCISEAPWQRFVQKSAVSEETRPRDARPAETKAAGPVVEPLPPADVLKKAIYVMASRQRGPKQRRYHIRMDALSPLPAVDLGHALVERLKAEGFVAVPNAQGLEQPPCFAKSTFSGMTARNIPPTVLVPDIVYRRYVFVPNPLLLVCPSNDDNMSGTQINLTVTLSRPKRDPAMSQRPLEECFPRVRDLFNLGMGQSPPPSSLADFFTSAAAHARPPAPPSDWLDQHGDTVTVDEHLGVLLHVRFQPWSERLLSATTATLAHVVATELHILSFGHMEPPAHRGDDATLVVQMTADVVRVQQRQERIVPTTRLASTIAHNAAKCLKASSRSKRTLPPLPPLTPFRAVFPTAPTAVISRLAVPPASAPPPSSLSDHDHHSSSIGHSSVAVLPTPAAQKINQFDEDPAQNQFDLEIELFG